MLAAYKHVVDAEKAKHGYNTVDVARIKPDAPNAAQARQKFLSEHTHDDDEDRFFARGAGVFYLHANEKVHAMLCEAGDLLSVPARTAHWFDMGTRPDFVAIRFFHDDDGWIGDFLGTDIAEKFPTFDELMASRAG